ncbi:thiamine-phosphate kinase [uncultured Propionibacterium sp.]|uniref:thiamine-phosphate kinase n=1 Tax=uncultured Propionibacterium sp. TaxID=218066 RepID=UPI0029318A09|nr:thiamine-phosphate kinase [uncultured Propionibacterium sp.]
MPHTRSSRARTVADVGEFGVIADIVRDLSMPPAVSVGPGDDSAVYLVNGSAVMSTDMLIEGVHFRRDWSSGTEIGRKAVAVNAADLEAVGAAPLVMNVGLGVPDDLPVQWVHDFATGLRAEADTVGLTLVGGDTTGARDVTICVTVIGQTDGREPVLRSGARPGDVVACCGRLGWAAAGLAALGRGFRSPRAAVDSQRVPLVPYGAGRQAAQSGATAMIDVSDGLIADLGHIADASGVRIDLRSAAFEVPDPVQAVAAATGKDPLGFVLTGGEDHALVATFPAGAVPPEWVEVGAVAEADGASAPEVTVDGAAWSGTSGGWEHFRS